jgi:hypothetical protein
MAMDAKPRAIAAAFQGANRGSEAMSWLTTGWPVRIAVPIGP